MDSDETGISFRNDLPYTEELNPYLYKSFYNGGGVGIGDLNGDGLPDLILVGNLVDNHVYLNRGDFTFERQSPGSGLDATGGWTSGVSIADVDGDGLLDVYYTKSGPIDGANRRNELRINQGDGTWVDVAASAGVDDYGLGVHAAFLDYDRDGDLDMYLLNNSIRSVGGYDIRPGAREVRDSAGGNKLYQNQIAQTDSLFFVDVSEAAGIYGSDIGFGLGVAVSDINGDDWPDMYVSNDFFERDYLYLNQADGTFREVLPEWIEEHSLGAMGADVADLTGDGYPELFVTEMLPQTPARYRSKASFQPYARQRASEAKGYHRQYSRNSYFVNRGGRGFTEASRAAGLEATDWSWGALVADFDNDGHRDIYVANGTARDLMDQDYVHYVANERNIRQWIREGGEVVKRLIDSMPSEPVPNRMFRNEGVGGLSFTDVGARWGLDLPSTSNGSAYGDLDGDGDLDLVVSQADGEALVYRNRTTETDAHAHFLKIALVDTLSPANQQAIGSKVEVYTPGRTYAMDLAPVRGFMSSVEPVLHFGLGETARVDSVRVTWSSGGERLVVDVEPDSLVRIARRVADPALVPRAAGRSPRARWTPTPWRHRESEWSDFDRYPLIHAMISAEGPALAATAEGGRERVFVGGAAGQPSAIVRIDAAGSPRFDSTAFIGERAAEDVAATWADVDGDGREDLIVLGGGDEFGPGDGALRPRLYRGGPGGTLRHDASAFDGPFNLLAGAVDVADVDGDGDVDVFFGTYSRLGEFGVAAASALLVNDGDGEFTARSIGALDTLDRVRAAVFCEWDGAPGLELAVAQDFGPVTVFGVRDTGWVLLAHSATGFWRSLTATDADGDGRAELHAGNVGTNTRMTPDGALSPKLYVGDYDGNGNLDRVTTFVVDSQEILTAQLGELLTSMPKLRKRLPRYADFATSSVADVLDPEASVRVLAVEETRSGVLEPTDSGALALVPYPAPAQMSTAEALHAYYVGDTSYVYGAGNYSYVKPDIGGQMSGTGFLLRYDAATSTWPLADRQLPDLKGEVRGIGRVGDRLVCARNDGSLVYLTLPTDE